MILVPSLEWHITDACNFTCEGCLHFSNHGHAGVIAFDQIESWIRTWSKRLIPREMAVLGGEPLLHKRVVDILYMARRYWHSSAIQVFELSTNGFLLEHYPDLPKALVDNECTLSVTKHYDNPAYNEKFAKVIKLVNDWREQHGIEARIDRNMRSWDRAYHGWGDTLTPYHDNNPEMSWKNCPTGQKCWQLYYNKIYKCPLVAYLPLVKSKFNLSSEWDPYLDYQALDPSATDEQIVAFFGRGAESCCGMCPAEGQTFIKQDPTLPISFYKKNNKI